MVTRDGVTSRLTAAKTAQAPAQLGVLLVGNRKEDFFLIREILERTRNMFAADLDHTSSWEEAKAMLKEKTYGLVLFEHETGITVPFIVLTEEADEKTVAEILARGTWNCVAKSHRDGATVVRTIRNTHTVLAANDGVDALAVAKNQGTPMDLLVSDVVMPNLANWRRNSLDCVRKKPLFVSGYAGKTVLETIKWGTLRPIFSRNPNNSRFKIRRALSPGLGQTNSPIHRDALD